MLIVMGDYAGRFPSSGFSGLCAALEPNARPGRALLITARPIPVSPRRLILSRVSLVDAHCERSGARSKSWAPPADSDASRRPQFAELLRLASRQRRPQADRARDP